MSLIAEKHRYETEDGYWITVARMSEALADLSGEQRWTWIVYRGGRSASSQDWHASREDAEAAARVALDEARRTWPDEPRRREREPVDW